MLISALVSFFLLTPQYESYTTLMFSRGPDQNYEDVMLSRQLASTYSEIAKSRSVTEAVIRNLRLDMTVAQLSGQITVSAVNNTEIISVKVMNPDPVLAKRIASQVATSFSKKIIGYSNIDNVIIVDEAVTPTVPISPNVKMNVAIAGVLGVMLALGLIFLLEFLDNTIKTQEDVEHFLGLSVLAMVPNNTKNKRGK